MSRQASPRPSPTALMPGEADVRAAFTAQALWCERLGSPFTSLLCTVLARDLGGDTPLGRRILDWPGNPDAGHDSVPLRLAGGLHALVRRGQDMRLAAVYPPNPAPEPARLAATIETALREHEAELAPWLDGPPQTNEVARSAVLMAGYLAIADRTELPLTLLELGASAGLNLLADRYGYRLGTLSAGEPGSPLQLAPSWSGADPPAAPVRVVGRRGVDLNPLDVLSATDRERLFAYIWADQAERLARMQAALAVATADPPPVDRDSADAWLADQLAAKPARGVARVVAHSIAFQYFPADAQSAISATLERVGREATAETPLAWLRYETDPAFAGRASLRLRLWPSGTDEVLALADPHGRSVEWRA